MEVYWEKILHISKVVAISKAYDTRFSTSSWGENVSENAHFVSIDMYFFEYMVTHWQQNTRVLWKISSCWENFGIKNYIKDC
jgi:hypothetical protein